MAFYSAASIVRFTAAASLLLLACAPTPGTSNDSEHVGQSESALESSNPIPWTQPYTERMSFKMIHPQPSGFTLVSKSCDTTGHCVIKMTYSSTESGDLTGTATHSITITCDQLCGATADKYFDDTAQFTGTVAGHGDANLTLHKVGLSRIQPGTTARVGEGSWHANGKLDSGENYAAGGPFSLRYVSSPVEVDVYFTGSAIPGAPVYSDVE